MSFLHQKLKENDTPQSNQNWALLSEHVVDPSIVQSNADPKEQILQFKVNNYRYFNVFVFVISALGNNLIVHTTSPITTYLENIFDGYSPTLISLCSLIFYILHPPMAFVSNYIIEGKGLKFGITCGAITMIIGTGIRCLVKEGFFFVIIGQVINALGNCFITNSPSKLAANWFLPKDRPAVTAISTFAVLASGALGLVVPSLFVTKTKQTEDDVFNLMLVEFIIIAVIMVFNIVCFRGNPPSAPSYAAIPHKKPAFSKMLKDLFSNTNYLFLLGFITLLLGTINAYVATMSLLMTPFGFFSIDVSLIGVFSIAFGFFGSIVGAIILKKSRKYQPIMHIGTLVASACMFIELVCLVQETDTYKWGAFIMSGFAGFFVYPVFSTALEFGCEIGYPAGEASVAGYLLAGSQVFGFVLGLIMTQILDGKSKSNSYIGGVIFLVLVFMSVIPLSFTKQDLRRSRQEVQFTLNENPIENEDLDKEIREKYIVDKEATKTIHEEIQKRKTIINN